MLSTNNFTLASIENRIQNSNGHWQHLGQSEWSVMEELSETLHIALNIDQGVVANDFTWEAVGLRVVIISAFDTEQLNLQISTDNANCREQLKELLLNFVRNGINDPEQVINELEMRRFLWGRLLGTLSENQAQGLFGEIFFMNYCLSEPLHQTITNWDGPDGSLNDFNWSDYGVHIEVKTSRKMSLPLQHEISSLHQLDFEVGHRLFLFSMSARIDAAGEQSLNELIENIRTSLLEIEAYPVTTEFYQKLADYGWNPNQEDFRFIVDTDLINLYYIEDGFPRIIPSQLNNLIDSRINIGSYRITMTNLDDFKIGFEQEISLQDLIDYESPNNA